MSGSIAETGRAHARGQAIERKFGTRWAFALLKEENVPEEVALRVLAHGPRQLRAGRAAKSSSPPSP